MFNYARWFPVKFVGSCASPRMSPCRPRPPTWALQQVGSYWGHRPQAVARVLTVSSVFQLSRNVVFTDARRPGRVARKHSRGYTRASGLLVPAVESTASALHDVALHTSLGHAVLSEALKTLVAAEQRGEDCGGSQPDVAGAFAVRGHPEEHVELAVCHRSLPHSADEAGES